MPMKRSSLTARRKAVGFSQDQLAEKLKVDRSTVARWESGETEPQPWIRPRLARALKVSVDKLGELLDETCETPVSSEAASIPSWVRVDGGRSASEHQPIQIPLSRTDISVVRGMVESLTAADHQFGGGFARCTADSFLREVIQPRLAAPGPNRMLLGFKAAAAELQIRVAWMHLDVADDTAARAAARKAFTLAQESEDLAMCSWVMAMSALLETWLGSTAAASSFGYAAVGLATDGPRLVQAFAQGKLARALAAGGDCNGALAGLAKARTLFETAQPHEDELVPGTIRDSYSSAYLLDEEAHCYRDLGMDAEALELSEQCLGLRGADRFTRNRAFATGNRALSLARLGEIDQACDSTLTLLQLAASLQSSRVVRRLDTVLDELKPFRTAGSVTGLIEQVNDAGITRQR
jgi:transcriptional regulator with XRE-family HTH domain/tetratricopeptide (TPR) repeat protein